MTEERQRDVMEETVAGNTCRGKPGSHGSKAILLSTCTDHVALMH